MFFEISSVMDKNQQTCVRLFSCTWVLFHWWFWNTVGIVIHNTYYYTLHIFWVYKSNKTIWMFYTKFADEGNDPVDNQVQGQ
jgi:hypothetical protein